MLFWLCLCAFVSFLDCVPAVVVGVVSFFLLLPWLLVSAGMFCTCSLVFGGRLLFFFACVCFCFCLCVFVSHG